MSPSLTLPEASRSAVAASSSWPAPSATTTTAWPRCSSRSSRLRQEAGEGEGDLRHQAEVDLAVDQGRVGGDEAGVAAHQLHQADAVARPGGLGVGGVDGPLRLGHRGLEAEGRLHEGDVVVDGLGDADDAERAAPAAGLPGDRPGPLQGAVAADGEEDADPQLLQGIDHLRRVLGAAGGGEDRAPQLADAGPPPRG